MLETGEFATLIELAAAERLDRSFVSHVLQLTLLSPDLVEAILDGRQSMRVQLQALVRGLPVEWERQRELMATSADNLSAAALREARPATGEVMSSHPCGTTGHG